MAAFDTFHLIYLISISAISIIFLVHTLMNRQQVTIRDATFEDYFRAWCEHHDVKTPIEELKGPLRPYLKSFFIVGKVYARTGITANKISLLGLIWAFWTLETWFLGGPWIFLGVLFVILSSTTDSIDGVVAYLTQTESKLGAYYDAVLDKFGDILWVAGPLYFVLTLAPYTAEWVVIITVLGLAGLFLAIIQEFCRARQEGLGLEETQPVIGERISRFCSILIITACFGISYALTALLPSASFVDVNVWITTYIIPICFISLIGLAVVSIIQLTRHAVKQWK